MVMFIVFKCPLEKISRNSNCRIMFKSGSRVVLDLMSGLNTQGYQLFTDNYYTSPEFYHTLYKLGINACGTVEAVRTNRRSFPKELIHFKREQFERGYRSCGPLLASFSLAGQPLH